MLVICPTVICPTTITMRLAICTRSARRVSPETIDKVREAVARLATPEAVRAAAQRILQEVPQSYSLTAEDALVLVQLLKKVASEGDEELVAFLRRGRLPDVIALTPRQMEYVRGGQLAVTETRGLAPETLLAPLW